MSGHRSVEAMASMTSVSYVAIIFFIVNCHSPDVMSSKVLGLFPIAGKSHMNAFNTLMVALVERGHEVTTFSPHPLKKNIPGLKELTILNVQELSKLIGHSPTMTEMKDTNPMTTVQILKDLSMTICEYSFTDDSFQSIINGDETYDVIFLSSFFNDCFLAVVHKLKAPLILISSFGSTPWSDDAVGNPYPYAYVPNAFLSFSDHMSFKDRFINTAVSQGMIYYFYNHYLPKADAIAKKYFGNDLPPLRDILYNASMVFLNNHLAFNYPRPILPTVLEVGGMHCRPAKPLPKDLQEFVDVSGDDGFIFFSMGTNLKSRDFPVAKREAFVNAFSKLKQRVIWKWEADELPGKPANVYIGKWLPQQDILGHPKIRAFITHGGLLSTQESIFHGIPLIGIPIYGDQSLNMGKAVTAGYGIKLDFDTISEKGISEALNKLLNDASYRENIKKRQSVFLDQPEDPLTRAVFWTEYVIRHKGAHHLRSAALDLSWYQLYLLDVIAVALVGILLVSAIVVTLLRFAYRSVCGGRTKIKRD